MRDRQYQESPYRTSGPIQRACSRQQGGSGGTDVVDQTGAHRRGPAAGPLKSAGDVRLAFAASQAHLGRRGPDSAEPVDHRQPEFRPQAAGNSLGQPLGFSESFSCS